MAFSGFSMINNVEVALRAKAIKVPKDTIMKMEDIIKLPDEKVCIVCTGSQGELNAVLNRMVTGAHSISRLRRRIQSYFRQILSRGMNRMWFRQLMAYYVREHK